MTPSIDIAVVVVQGREKPIGLPAGQEARSHWMGTLEDPWPLKMPLASSDMQTGCERV